MKPAREPASSRPKPRASLKNVARIWPVRRFSLALVGRKQAVVRDQVSPRNLPIRAFDSRFSRTGVQHSPGSSTIEFPSALAESDACSSDRALLRPARKGLGSYSKVKRINRGYVTHYTIKLTLRDQDYINSSMIIKKI